MDFNKPVQEFEQRYKRETNARAKIRLQILFLRRQKYLQQEISAIVRVTQGTVSNVCRRFKDEGWSSVYDKPRSGKPSRLTIKQKEKLCELMQKPIIVDKKQRGWFVKDVEKLLRDKYNVVYSRRNVEKLLHKLKMSWKVPRPKHQRQNFKEVCAFKKTSRGRYCLWQPIIK